MKAIEIQNLTKLYPNGKGIIDISIEVEKGEIFGFLGPNGAGKSTTIRTLMGFLFPDKGKASILDLDVVSDTLAVRAKVGYLPSEITLYNDLSGLDNIRFSTDIRRINGYKRAESLADRLGVDLKRALKSLSRGQKQKVAIIAALVHDPEVIILDEPTTGLDPLMQEEFNTLIKEQQSLGKTVFMSSHILSDVEQMCPRVAVIKDGKIVTIDSIENLRKQRRKHVTVSFASEMPDLSLLPGIEKLKVEGLKAKFAIKGELNELLRVLTPYRMLDFTVNDPSLEEVFREFYLDERG